MNLYFFFLSILIFFSKFHAANVEFEDFVLLVLKEWVFNHFLSFREISQSDYPNLVLKLILMRDLGFLIALFLLITVNDQLGVLIKIVGKLHQRNLMDQ